MRARRLVAVALLTALATIVVPQGPARAVWLQEHGWWWMPQGTVPGIELPPPGDVPEDGLLVEKALTGPSAVAALRIDLEGGAEPVLVLETATPGVAPPDDTIVACPPTSYWLPASAGAWSQRPEPDCDRGEVAGVVDEMGQTWTWDLAELVVDGRVDVVLLPRASGSLRVAFGPPTDESVRVVPVDPPAGGTPPTPDDAATSPDPSPAVPTSPPTTSPPPGPPTAPSRPTTVGPPPSTAPSHEVPAPRVAPRQGPAVVAPSAPSTPVASPAVDLAPGLPRRVGWALVVGVLLTALVLARTDGPWHSPAHGGLGRFRHARAGDPPPLR